MKEFGSEMSVALPTRGELHLPRKIWHLAMGLFIVGLYLGTGMGRATAVGILAGVFVFALAVETLRLQYPGVNSVTMRILAPLMRSHEVRRFSTVPYYVGAALLAIGLFPKDVAMLALMYLAVGGPMASLFGILFGRLGPRFASGKTLIGTCAGVVSCAAVTAIYLSASSLAAPEIAALAVFGGVAGGTAELLPIDIDDNFTIPMFSGLALWLAFIVIGA